MSAPQASSGPATLDRTWAFLAGTVTAVFERLLGWDVTWEGLENVPATGGAVVVWNHHSYSDFLFVALGIVRHRERPLRILGKSEVWENPITRWFADRVGAVPVHRTTPGGGRDALAAAIAALEAGDLVMLAPEQTISQSFELLPFATGAARMALAADVPIVPVAGWGSQRGFTKGHAPQVVRNIPVQVVYGEPVTFADDTTVEEATADLHAVLEPMVHRLQDEYPDQPEPGDDWWVPRRLGGSARSHDDVLAEHDAWSARRHTSPGDDACAASAGPTP